MWDALLVYLNSVVGENRKPYLVLKMKENNLRFHFKLHDLIREIKCKEVIQKPEGKTGVVCNLGMAEQTLKEVIPNKGGTKIEICQVIDFIQASDPC